MAKEMHRKKLQQELERQKEEEELKRKFKKPKQGPGKEEPPGKKPQAANKQVVSLTKRQRAAVCPLQMTDLLPWGRSRREEPTDSSL